MLYPLLLGPDFEKLPQALRDFHGAPSGERASGAATVKHDNPWLARIVGFPPAGEDIPVRLEVVAEEDSEEWRREFGGTTLDSIQRRDGNLLLETFGVLRLFFRVFPVEHGLRLELQRARLGIIPLPLRIEASERGCESGWEFEVNVAGIGSYRGKMGA